MKYVLVDNYDNITHQKDFDSNIEYSSIKEYFIKLKATDAGVDELNGMLDRVRMERTGTTIQPSPMRSGGILPA